MEINEPVQKYTYRVEWSAEDEAHIARALEFPSLIAHGDTTEQALSNIEQAVSETVKWMREVKETVPEPFGLKR